jgi:hypothetical protein
MKSTTLNRKIELRAWEIWCEKQMEGVNWCKEKALARAIKEHKEKFRKTWSIEKQIEVRSWQIWYEKQLEGDDWCLQRATARAIAERQLSLTCS